ncbi:DUF4153 domain-containing protein [Youngiibacter fragilis]|uniref:Membrane protein n=1 Tax=Youngiibacter fragilis 232.1 TaxID=994573 RepID=V7I6Z7_9CLOT|nr:DUF4153 domain-containing protein [Youngiibacter fragilis]ETA81623.1 membrane protein [Youngiibacter fragilis 232.1]
MSTENMIIENLAKPHELERMFREEPEVFKSAFNSAYEQNRESQVLSVWFERLYFKEDELVAKNKMPQSDFMVMGALAVFAGISSRIIMYFAELDKISPINVLFGVIPFICAYFLYRSKPEKKILYSIISLIAISIIYMNLLPKENTDSIMLSYMHLPVFLWVLMGFSFTGNEFGSVKARLSFLKFNGEFLIIYATMAISGMMLTGLTLQLFSVAGFDISEFYFENIVLFGAAALSVVASYLVTTNMKLAKSIAPYIAKIFSPLILITLVTYLIVVAASRKNPFLDRNFLLVFNGILISILAISIFSITESTKDAKKSISDYVNFILIAVALVMNAIALSAIVFRLASYGITPNRIAVVGLNILIFGNLIWIISSYAGFIRNEKGSSAIQNAVTKYLPAYGIWAAFVTFAFPIIFS